MDLHPNYKEKAFLYKAYNLFYARYEEIINDSFWQEEGYCRFSKIRDCFLVYSELLEYEPIDLVIESLKKLRPPMEAEISKQFFSFLRNLLVHFPLFDTWDEVCFDKDVINWSKPGKSIDRFLENYKGHAPVKYRMWNPKTKVMTYLSINFPPRYSDGTKIFLKDMLSEKEGVIFSLNLMKKVLDTQVEK